MAAQQEMLRNAMQKHMDDLEKYGINDHGLEKALGDMEKTEEELINKIIDQETINRQKDILTRLLKSEKSTA